MTGKSLEASWVVEKKELNADWGCDRMSNA